MAFGVPGESSVDVRTESVGELSLELWFVL